MAAVKKILIKWYPVISVPAAWLAFLWLSLHKKKNQLMLVLHEFLGDEIYGLSCLDSLRACYPEKKIVVVASDRHEKLLRTYRQIDWLILLPHGKIRQKWIKCFIRNAKLSQKGLAKGIVNVTPYQYSTLRGAIAGWGVRAMIREKLFHLPEDLPITCHALPKEPVSAISGFARQKKRIAVINPYSYSTPYTPGLYEKLCHILIERGFLVYTNVVDGQEAIRGSLPLRCGICQLYSIACDIPLFVSVRSGIVDFLIPSGVNMFVIYETESELSQWIAEHYFLYEWHPKGRTEEVIIEAGSGCEGVCQQFAAYLEKLQKSGVPPSAK